MSLLSVEREIDDSLLSDFVNSFIFMFCQQVQIFIQHFTDTFFLIIEDISPFLLVFDFFIFILVFVSYDFHLFFLQPFRQDVFALVVGGNLSQSLSVIVMQLRSCLQAVEDLLDSIEQGVILFFQIWNLGPNFLGKFH